MAVKTWRMTPKDLERAQCIVCGKPAHYWSQNEQKGGRAVGQVVYHCQVHRDQARQIAGGLNAKINQRAATKTIRAKDGLTPVGAPDKSGLGVTVRQFFGLG